jgi:hypothetical protein
VTRPTPFDKMRANRRRQRPERVSRLIAQIDTLEQELAAEWREADVRVPGAQRTTPPRRRLFGWLLKDA